MEKQRAVPKGFMTVGEVAKKMNVTVRTVQHYDREGLLSPSSISEEGRRIYTDRIREWVWKETGMEEFTHTRYNEGMKIRSVNVSGGQG